MPVSHGRRFLNELKRRKVVRAVMVYLASAFAVIQAADVVLPVLRAPEWAMGLVVGLSAVGVPVAIGLAWAFDLTDRGLTLDLPEGGGPQSVPARWFSVKTAGLTTMMLGVGLAAGWLARTASLDDGVTTGERSIAVIPFDNLSTEAENAFLAVGVQDEILTQLGKISDLRVISRSSVMQYQPGPDRVSIPDIGRALAARWIVEGSVARVGENIRINVQLIESRTDAHAWAEAFDGDLTVQGILAFQAQVARRVAESLSATIRPDEEARIASVPTHNTAAYELYLRANELFAYRREAELRRALELYDEAITVDSAFAHAYAGQALVHAVLPFYSDETVMESYAVGLVAAERALALDSALAEAHAAIGDMVFHRDYDAGRAEASLLRAIQLKPSFAQAWAWLAEPRLARRLPDEALAATQRALRLDPLSVRFNSMLGTVLVEKGDLDAAIEQLEKTADMDPGSGSTHEVLGRALMLAGRHEEAAATYRRYSQAVGGDDTAILERMALAVASGDDARLAEVGRELDAVPKASWRLSPVTIAEAYVWVGRHDTALDWLERGLEIRDATLPSINGMSVFDPIRQQVRFQVLVREMGLG